MTFLFGFVAGIAFFGLLLFGLVVYAFWDIKRHDLW